MIKQIFLLVNRRESLNRRFEGTNPGLGWGETLVMKEELKGAPFQNRLLCDFGVGILILLKLPNARSGAYFGCCFFLNSPITLSIGFCCCCCCWPAAPGCWPAKTFSSSPVAIPFTSGVNFGSAVVP